MKLAPVSTLAVFLLFSNALQAADYLGASAVLRKATPPKEESAVNASTDSPKQFLADLKAFKESLDKLPPTEAASGWIKLVDRMEKFSNQELFEAMQGSRQELDPGLSSLVRILPPPATWDQLIAAVAARPESKSVQRCRKRCLLAVLDWLNGDTVALNKDYEALRSLVQKLSDGRNEMIRENLDRAQEDMLKHSTDGPARLAAAQRQVAAAVKMVKSGKFHGEYTIQLPDLADFAGAKETSALLKEVLETNGLVLNFVEDCATRKLASQLALNMGAELKAPQWNLVQTLEDAPLFEAMAKRFQPQGNPFAIERARSYYLLSLILAQKTKEAITVAKEMKMGDSFPSGAIESIERAGRAAELSQSLHDLLEKEPTLPLWEAYLAIAPRVGQSAAMVGLAEAASKREGLTPAQQLEVLKVLAHAYLAADQVDSGIGILRKQIALEQKENSSTEFHGSDEPACRLASLGLVLDRSDLVEEGIKALKKQLPSDSSSDSSSRTQIQKQIASILAEAGKGPEAEFILAEALERASKNARRSPDSLGSTYETREILRELVALYHRANRPADVLMLLNQARGWGATDLREIATDTVSWKGNDDYLGFFAAKALADSGRVAEARAITEYLLDRKGGYDPAYELLLKIAPESADAKLDALFARDAFEERPLIWKAALRFNAGELDQAEKYARQAIAIDPTDGEQGPGRRLRAYALLGQIREARGDKKEAGFLKEVLISVQHSEKADRFHSAGLVTRSLKLYEESLTHFADAYCIQARLAFRMAELGNFAAAEEHYRRAYELMPDSFGRLESYCFGCEGAFQGSQAQGIAERVFTKLAQEQPNKPQVHYLLGYLYSEQERSKEALEKLRKAVQLDPDYLKAWKLLSETKFKALMSSSERDEVQLNLLRLDPLGRHTDFQIETFAKPRLAREALQKAAPLRPKSPATLYPLADFAAELTRAEQKGSRRWAPRYHQTFIDGDQNQSPAEKISFLPAVMLLNQLYMSAPQMLQE